MSSFCDQGLQQIGCTRHDLHLCWRVQALFDLQLSSIKHYSIATFTPDVKVHYIVLRYAQLTASLLCLNADYQVYYAAMRSLDWPTLQWHASLMY